MKLSLRVSHDVPEGEFYTVAPGLAEKVLLRLAEEATAFGIVLPPVGSDAVEFSTKLHDGRALVVATVTVRKDPA